MDVYARLKELDIELLPVPPAAGAFVNGVAFGDGLMYMSGGGPRTLNGKFEYVGKVGLDLDEAEAYKAARSVGITMLSNLHAAIGDLNRVTKIVKVTGFVNATPDFTSHPKVINGFSELMLEVFGREIGAHARSAVGMGSLPANIPVEVEMLVAYK